MNITNIKRK